MQMFLLIMKTWREHVFFGRFRWTFLIQTCEGQSWEKKITWVCWQTVVNCRKRGKIVVIFKPCTSENISQWQHWADATSYFLTAIPLLRIYHCSLTDRAICIVRHLPLATCLYILSFSVCIISTMSTSCSPSLCEGFWVGRSDVSSLSISVNQF